VDADWRRALSRNALSDNATSNVGTPNKPAASARSPFCLRLVCGLFDGRKDVGGKWNSYLS